MPPKILVITGPTASGKTALAVELAKRHNGEVISADSMQIYRRMDIGTAKPTEAEKQGIPHHMLDVAGPEEDFSVARYVDMAARCVEDVLSRGKLPILAGGTGLYIDSLLSGRTFAAFDGQSPLRGELEARYAREGGQALLHELSQADPETAARLRSSVRDGTEAATCSIVAFAEKPVSISPMESAREAFTFFMPPSTTSSISAVISP